MAYPFALFRPSRRYCAASLRRPSGLASMSWLMPDVESMIVSAHAMTHAPKTIQNTYAFAQRVLNNTMPSLYASDYDIAINQYNLQIVQCRQSEFGQGFECAIPSSSGVIGMDVDMPSVLKSADAVLREGNTVSQWRRGGQVGALAVVPLNTTMDNAPFPSTTRLQRTPQPIIMQITDSATGQLLLQSQPFNGADVRDDHNFGLYPSSVLPLGNVVPFLDTPVNIVLRAGA